MSICHVENGELVGKTDKGLKHNEFLKSKLAYGDFRLVVKIKLVPNEGNSGIQFHCDPFHGNEMSGPQADAGKGWWGKLYGENFGNKVIGENKSGEQIVKPNDWNTYEILAVGTKVRTAINGHLCVDVDDPKIAHERHLRPPGPRRRTDRSPLQRLRPGAEPQVRDEDGEAGGGMSPNAGFTAETRRPRRRGRDWPTNETRRGHEGDTKGTRKRVKLGCRG